MSFSTDIKDKTTKAVENKFLIKLCMQKKIFHSIFEWQMEVKNPYKVPTGSSYSY